MDDADTAETLKPLWKIGRDAGLTILPLFVASAFHTEAGASGSWLVLGTLASVVIYTGVKMNDRARIREWSKHGKEVSLTEIARVVESISEKKLAMTDRNAATVLGD